MPPAILISTALVLLFFPLWAFRRKTSRLGNFDQRTWPNGGNAVLMFFDVARALAGGSLLARGFGDVASWPLNVAWMNDVWLAVAFVVAALIQAFSWKNEDYLMAPAGFWLGAMAAVVHPLVLLIALPLGIGGALALRAWTGFFVGIGIGVAGAGLAVTAQNWRTALFLGAGALGVVLAAPLAGRHWGGLRK